ncbi:MAG: hypothetical protein K5871_02715 [Lachnospiraceae bacterium]|nr:hypothetical protein [Lachnospiraceae bacterium]
MTLRKTKVSIVTNAIYILVASALCIITIMDGAEGLGFSYLPGLVAFAVIMALGLVLKKVLSFTANSDKIKAITDKGDLFGSIIFVVLLIFSVVFRFASYSWSGLGGTAYFEIAKVTETEMSHYVHACDDWYLTALHAVFFLFGNRIFIAAIFNCVLQAVAVIFGFLAFRKMLGMIPALFFTAFWTITGFSVHEALTLNSRNLVFFLVTLTLFSLSTCIPASAGKFFSYLISGLLTAVCIYADVAGLVLIPFILGILLNDQSEEEDNSFGLRISKMFFTLVSVVFGLVLLIFVDSYLTSSNPFSTLSSMVSLYTPSDMFTLGFSYMTSYVEILVMAVLVSLGIFVCFFTEDESRLIILLSGIVILVINNFGMTYLENDGREIFFMLGAVLAGVSFRDLFPAEITGDVFKASAEMYDNEFSAPEKGYVPSGIKPADPSAALDDLSDLDIKPNPDPVPAKKISSESGQKTEPEQVNEPEHVCEPDDANGAGQDQKPENAASEPAKDDRIDKSVPSADAIPSASRQTSTEGLSPMEMFDAVILPRPGQDTKPHISQGQLTSQAIQATLPPEQPQEAPAAQPSHASQVSFASDNSEPASSAITPAKAENESAGNGSGEKKKSVYVPYGKPQLKPEYRRRPGAWMQAINEKNNLNNNLNKDDNSDNKDSNETAVKEDAQTAPATQPPVNEKQETAQPEQHAPEKAPNGAVLLENPIPHPVRKTDHKSMEYDIDVTDSMMDYDIRISDNDDFDI